MPPSLEEFLSDNGGALLSMAISLAGSKPEGQDLLQDALVHCYPKWNSISEGAHLSYVRRSLVNRSISNWRRKHWREVPLDGLEDVPADGHSAEAVDEGTLLRAALRRLPTNQRVAVTLRYVHDLPLEDVSEMMNVPAGTIKSWCHRGLAGLRNSVDLVGRDLGGVENE